MIILDPMILANPEVLILVLIHVVLNELSHV